MEEEVSMAAEAISVVEGTSKCYALCSCPMFFSPLRHVFLDDTIHYERKYDRQWIT